MRTRNLFKTSALALTLRANGICASAQETPERRRVPQTDEEKRQVEIIVRGQEGTVPLPPGEPFGGTTTTFMRGGAGDNTFVFVATEMSFSGKTVKGAPYSAQAVTEMIQTLADGNRIVRRNTASIFRDGEGRTRREQTFGTIGPYTTEGEPPQTFFINDPIAEVNYILDPRTRTARKIPMPRHLASWNLPEGLIEKPVKTIYPPAAIAAGVEGKVKLLLNVSETGEVESVKVIEGHKLLQQAAVDAAKQLRLKPTLRNGTPVKVQRELFFDFQSIEDAVVQVIGEGGERVKSADVSSRTKKESLGKQMVEGVEAEGTRTTLTIPAGEVGNEQPINIVSERWYSNELQTVVMTRHNDPRNGETIYRLTNINRSEPARSLFEVPGDYTIKETPTFNRTLRTTRRTAPPAPPDEL